MRMSILGYFTWLRKVFSYQCFRRTISPNFKNQVVQGEILIDGLTLQDGTDKSSRNFGSNLPFYATYKTKGKQIFRKQNFRSCQHFLQEHKEIQIQQIPVYVGVIFMKSVEYIEIK
jgi:hypothetical protein